MSYSIHVYNHSTVVSDADVFAMVLACDKYFIKFCSNWNVVYPKISFIKGKTVKLIPNIWVFVVIDDTDIADTLAYHQDPHEEIAGYIFAKTILQYGGVVLYDGNKDTVACALCHEIAEAIINPSCNGWWDNLVDTYYAYEVCDPVQANIVPVSVRINRKNVVVGLSDYILPAWSDVTCSKGPYNYKNTLSAPFTLDPGGYCIIRSYTGTENAIFGATNDQLSQQKIKAKKNKYSRMNYIATTHHEHKNK